MQNQPQITKDNKRMVEIGKARVNKIANKYHDLGYLVIENDANHSGADLIIVSLPDGKIKKIIEVTNYKRPDEYIDDNRLERYIGSLTYFGDIEGVEFELVVSFLNNLTANQLIELKKNDIHVHVEGSQDLPENKPNLGWKD